ncbi:MAG: hypothetical protein Kow0092_12840 [Deferrisomatales bacterium]
MRGAAVAAAALAAFLALAAAPPVARTAEAPPPQGSRLHFQRTLSVQQAGPRKIFAETRRVAEGDSLWRILRRDYQIPPEALGTFVEAFRAVNPEVDPDRLVPGEVVRVPFKVEEAIGPAPGAAATYTVRAGDSLWRILARRFGVSRDRMGEALQAVARANPRIRDLDRLLVGQQLRIPAAVTGASGEAEGPASSLPPRHRGVLALLRELGCTVSDTGTTYLPLGRGRTVRLDAGEFPLVVGPAGRRVLLDPRERLSPALAGSVEEAWGYKVVRGTSGDAEGQLERLLPHLGFHELARGTRSISLGRAAELVAAARWTVVPRARDLWEGRVHLLFPAGSTWQPALGRAAARAGFALHVLGAPDRPPDPQPVPPPPTVSMADPVAGLAELLSLLGVPHQVRPEIDCELAGGVHYRLRPALVFRHAGTRYAVPPLQPPNAESMLFRAGYFTVGWPAGAAPLNRMGDVLALLGIPHARSTVEIPARDPLRLRVTGLVVDHPGLARLLYPSSAASLDTAGVFVTEGPIPPGATPLFLHEGILPWVVRTR